MAIGNDDNVDADVLDRSRYNRPKGNGSPLKVEGKWNRMDPDGRVLEIP